MPARVFDVLLTRVSFRVPPLTLKVLMPGLKTASLSCPGTFLIDPPPRQQIASCCVAHLFSAQSLPPSSLPDFFLVILFESRTFRGTAPVPYRLLPFSRPLSNGLQSAQLEPIHGPPFYQRNCPNHKPTYALRPLGWPVSAKFPVYLVSSFYLFELDFTEPGYRDDLLLKSPFFSREVAFVSVERCIFTVSSLPNDPDQFYLLFAYVDVRHCPPISFVPPVFRVMLSFPVGPDQPKFFLPAYVAIPVCDACEKSLRPPATENMREVHSLSFWMVRVFLCKSIGLHSKSCSPLFPYYKK